MVIGPTVASIRQVAVMSTAAPAPGAHASRMPVIRQSTAVRYRALRVMSDSLREHGWTSRWLGWYHWRSSRHNLSVPRKAQCRAGRRPASLPVDVLPIAYLQDDDDETSVLDGVQDAESTDSNSKDIVEPRELPAPDRPGIAPEGDDRAQDPQPIGMRQLSKLALCRGRDLDLIGRHRVRGRGSGHAAYGSVRGGDVECPPHRPSPRACRAALPARTASTSSREPGTPRRRHV